MEETETKAKVLQALKNYYADFVDENAALHPSKVKNIKYFLDWLINATENDITQYEEKMCHVRQIDFRAIISGKRDAHEDGVTYDKVRSNCYSYTVFITEDKYFASANHKHYVTYHPLGGSTVIPSTKTIASDFGKLEYYKDHSYNYQIDKTKVLETLVGDPVEMPYLACTITYPHKKKVENLQFVVYGDTCAVMKKGPKKGRLLTRILTAPFRLIWASIKMTTDRTGD